MDSFDPSFVADVFWVIGGLVHSSIAIVVYGWDFFLSTVLPYIIISALAGWLNGVYSNKAIQLIGANRWITLNMAHIIFTMIAASLLLNEILTIEKVLGAGLIITAIYKLNYLDSRLHQSDRNFD